jgi:hypothetical protein
LHLIPNHCYPSIYDIDPAELANGGIRLLLADLDNTLAAYGQRTAPPELHTWKENLERHGVTLFILSNSRKPTRARRFAESLGVPYVNRAGKPRTASFFRVMKEHGVTPAETAIVGDQIFTDILGGNRAGVRTCLVHPVQLDTGFRRLRFRLETPFRSACPNVHNRTD